MIGRRWVLRDVGQRREATGRAEVGGEHVEFTGCGDVHCCPHARDRRVGHWVVEVDGTTRREIGWCAEVRAADAAHRDAVVDVAWGRHGRRVIVAGRGDEHDVWVLEGERVDRERLRLRGRRVAPAKAAVDDVGRGAADALEELPVDGDRRCGRGLERTDAARARGIRRRNRTRPKPRMRCHADAEVGVAAGVRA